jgi:glycogen debranching enzyme
VNAWASEKARRQDRSPVLTEQLIRHNAANQPDTASHHMLRGLLAIVLCLVCVANAPAAPPAAADKDVDGVAIRAIIPSLETDNPTLNEAFRIAIGDLLGNVSAYKYGKNAAFAPHPRAPLILAGLHYDTPWTRDAAINAWNGASLIVPEVSRDTLASVLEVESHGANVIGGQYWDAMIWTTGAWNHYLYSGDKAFLTLAFEATQYSLLHFEIEEFDDENGLFRGPGWSDGVAGYPDAYADAGGSASILDWPKQHPDKVSKPGYGIPMEALSTNCIYYNAYVIAGKMARELKQSDRRQWKEKAANLKKAINKHFWNEKAGCYRYLVGPLGNCDQQEGIGSAYAILFDIADVKQTEAIFNNQHITPAGIPCGWPNFSRYESKNGKSFGRHIGTVWPQIQGFWAEAAARAGKPEIFGHELFNLATHAVRDRQFAEIYHPLTGEIYGGLQENGGRIVLWNATSRQTWSATAYIRMVLMGLAGMRFDSDGVRFQPVMPKGVGNVHLSNIRYRKMALDITIQGNGAKIKQCRIDGKEAKECFLPADGEGRKVVTITVGNS